MRLRSITLKSVNAILVMFLCLEYASELPVFSLPSLSANEIQHTSSATRSTHMSDREKAGLRGPARTCVEENDLPDARKYSTTWEYSPDGRLLTNRVTNPDGSAWLTIYTYHPDGRLAKVVSGKPGEPGSDTVYAYEAGRLLAITKNGGEGGRTEFHYDEQGRKSSIQTFDPKVLERAQNSAFSVSPWDAAVAAGIGVPLGGNISTIYDENDKPTEAQIRDTEGRVISRFVRKYDASGQISEEKPFLENPAALFLDRFPAEERTKLGPAEVSVLSTLLAGRAPAGNSFSYDPQGRVSKTWERNMMFEKTTSVIYNDQGDKAVEGTIITDNSIIPVGVPHSIDEHGALVPSEPSVEPQPSPLPEQSEVHFAYQYDSHGNWTQQTATYISGGVTSSTTRSRKLTYY